MSETQNPNPSIKIEFPDGSVVEADRVIMVYTGTSYDAEGNKHEEQPEGDMAAFSIYGPFRGTDLYSFGDVFAQGLNRLVEQYAPQNNNDDDDGNGKSNSGIIFPK